MSELALTLPEDVVEAIARRTAEIVLAQLREERADEPEHCTLAEACEILRCKPQRVYNLASEGRLTRVKEGGRGRGGRTLYVRAELRARLRGEETGPFAQVLPSAHRDRSASGVSR